MEMVFVLALSCMAGLLSGTFAVPTKLANEWKPELLWLVFSFFGFIIFPFGFVYFFTKGLFFQVLSDTPSIYIVVAILGGIAFGVGQTVQCIAFRFVGIGITYIINISIGTAGTAMLPLLWNREYIGTFYSYLQIAGSLIFVLAVVAGGVASYHRDQQQDAGREKTKHRFIHRIIGILLAVIAGFGTASEGLAYVYSNPAVSEIAERAYGLGKIASTNVVWGIIFVVAWFPFFGYYLYQCMRGGSSCSCFGIKPGKHIFWAAVMGILYWIPLVIFSKVSSLMGSKLAPTIAWPLFMVFIILSSNLWSFFLKEWKSAPRKAVKEVYASLTLFVIAIIIFSISRSFL